MFLLLQLQLLFHVMYYWQALSQSDGRWRYSSDNPESSTYAAGNDLYGNMMIFYVFCNLH